MLTRVLAIGDTQRSNANPYRRHQEREELVWGTPYEIRAVFALDKFLQRYGKILHYERSRISRGCIAS